MKRLQRVCIATLPGHGYAEGLAERVGFEPTLRNRTTAFEF